MFFDTPYSELPKRAQYYFNILIISIAVQPEVLTDILGHKNTVDLWDVQNINNARPTALHIYASYNLDRDSDYDARLILSELSGLPVNAKTQDHTAEIIFEGDRFAKSQFVYTDLATEFPGYTYDFGKS